MPNFRVINNDLATLATNQALMESWDSKSFLQSIDLFRKRNKANVLKVLNRRQIERKLFFALVREQELETRVVLSKYWEELIEDNEKLRYSLHSKEAFAFLRRVYKYSKTQKKCPSYFMRNIFCIFIIISVRRENELISL